MHKIYTKTGDSGETSLVGGTRVKKDDYLIELYGTCDELNAFVGMLIAEKPLPFLTTIQRYLFAVGGILSTPIENYEQYWKEYRIEDAILDLEKEIDKLSENLPPLKSFILPQGSKEIACAHVCRTICRRWERRIARLANEEAYYQPCLKFANRLSDYFFILSVFFHKEKLIPA